MSFFLSVPAPRPVSFCGIYSEDNYTNDMVQRTANDYALAHTRVQAFERQRDHHYHPHHHHHHHHHQHRQRRFGGPHRGCFASASLDNFSYGFAPACTRPALYTPHRRPAAYSPEQLAYQVCQKEERRNALNRQLETIAREQELAREREAQRRRALAEAAAREQQARAARTARIEARQAHDQEILLALLGQLGLAVAPARSAPAPVIREQPSPSEQQARAAHTARIQARQAREQELLFALLEQSGLAVDPAQSAPIAPPVNKPQPPVQITHNAVPTAVTLAPSPIPVDRKGKGKAVDVPAETPTLSPNPVLVPAKVPTLKEELEARIRSETDPEVRESLVLLYSDIFDARQPAQPVAGPSGHKHVSFEIPITCPSSSTTPSPVPVKTEEIDTTTVPVLAERPEADDTKIEGHHGAPLHRTPTLPPAIAAKLLKFYRARRARKLSLAQITGVEDALRKLEGAFEFPAHLDFVDRSPSPLPSPVSSESDTESALAYTANNTPIHAYEHALNDLLTRLDAVESNGDLEVRGRRKEVVKEVERALEAMERRIEESRERSRERARRGSVSSQVSDASVTVTPYNVHSSDNVDKVEVAVATEEVEEPKTTLEAQDVSPIAEDVPLQVEVSEPVPAATDDSETREVAPSPPSVDSVESDYAHLAAGIPDNDADIYASPPSDLSVHGDPSAPVDDDEDLVRVFNVPSSSDDVSASHPPSTINEATVPSTTDDEHEVTMLGHVDAAGQDVLSDGIATAPTLESDAAVASPLEATEEANSISLSSFATPEAISRIESSTTDTTFVTAEADSVPLSAADDGMFFAAGIMTPSEAELSPTLAPAPAPPSNSESASSAGEDTFLLSSTPLADEQPKKQRRLSTSESVGDDSDDLEIIGKDELEAVRNDSDWSDFESESDADL